MLKMFHRRGMFVKILLWMIVLGVGGVMVITMVPGLGGGAQLTDPAGNLAQIGGSAVTQVEANRVVAQQMRQFGAVDNQVFRQLLLERVVQDLIDRRALLYEASRLGLEITRAEVVTQLQSITDLYPGGKFVGQDIYRNVIQQQFGMNPGEFERQIRDDLLLQKLNMWITGGAQATSADIEQEYRRRNDKVRLEYVVLQPREFVNRMDPSDEDLRAYFDENREAFQLPEQRSIRYVEVNTAILHSRVQVPDADIERLYRERRGDYLEPEAVQARRLYFPAVEAATREESRKTAEEALDRVKQGEDFAQVAGGPSLDGTVPQGIEPEWIERNQVDEDFGRKLFAVSPGGEPELIEVSHGFFIVQVLDRRAERVRPLSEARGELESSLKRQLVQQRAFNEARQITQDVRSGQTLDDAAQTVNWRASELPLLPRNQPWIIVGQEGSEAAFRLPVGERGQATDAVSEPVAIPSGYVVIQLKEVSPAHQAEYAEAGFQVRGQYLQQKAGDMARETALQLSENAGLNGLAAAAGRAGLTAETSDFVSRNDVIPALGAVSEFSSAVFSLSVGEVAPARQVGANWAVFRLLEHREPDMEGLAAERDALAEELSQQKRGVAWEIFRSTVRRRLEKEEIVQVNTVALNTLLRRR